MVLFPEVLTPVELLECLFIGAHELAVEIEHTHENFVWVSCFSSPLFGPVLSETSKNHRSKLVIFGIMAAPSASFCAVMSSLSCSFLESKYGKAALQFLVS